MTILRLAWRNLIGARTRTWLNVTVLSLSFVTIIGLQGVLQGMEKQVEDATMAVQYGGGQYWQKSYDPYDPLSLTDAHAQLPPALQELVSQGKATPILVTQGTIYPKGRGRPVLLKGIDPAQSVLEFPSSALNPSALSGDTASSQGTRYRIEQRIRVMSPDANSGHVPVGTDLPAVIGSRMALSTGLKAGDYVTVQWRTVNGAFDARDVRIAQVISTPVQEIDVGQIWLALDELQTLTAMPGQATYVVIARGSGGVGGHDPNRLGLGWCPLTLIPGWTFHSLGDLLHDVRAVIKAKTGGSAVFYVILLLLAMLAIFDTQVLSIFRRRKEMGTLMALGMTRGQVIRLFTLEGALHGVLAAIVGAIYGIPLLWYLGIKGWALPKMVDTYGYAVGNTLYPAYGVGLVVGTTVLVLVVTTIVSFLPTRRIARLKPTDALRGRWT